MSEYERKAFAEMQIIREILGWKWHSDDVKHYFIKSFLLGWTSADYIHEMTSRDERHS